MIEAFLSDVPLVAILRGVPPDESVAVGQAIYEAGIRCIEVPLNSPDPFDSIARLAGELPADCLVGAGTVTVAAQVRKVRSAGGKLIVTPNTSVPVILAGLDAAMAVVPGVATPTEAFTAVQAGATFLKLFPASTFGENHLRALRAVLPGEIRVLAVGGIGPDAFATWRAAGASAFGMASELYRGGDTAEAVGRKASEICAALRADIDASE